jgi:hypothetical protein
MESVPVFVFILAVTRKNASQDAQNDGRFYVAYFRLMTLGGIFSPSISFSEPCSCVADTDQNRSAIQRGIARDKLANVR